MYIDYTFVYRKGKANLILYTGKLKKYISTQMKQLLK